MTETASARILVVDEDSAGQRLDNFLIRHLKGVPKTWVYRIIRTGEVRVNKGRANADTRVQAGDRVRVPPLRDYAEDVPELLRYCVDRLVDTEGLPFRRFGVAAQKLDDAVWTALLLYLPLSALFWHAPALVYWHGVPAVKSLFFSLTACVANWKALTVYMLSWTALYAGVGLALMVAGSLVGGSEGVGLAVVPIMLMFTAMFFCSVYFTYRDSFEPAGSGPDPL
mgnify:CR=1 FL=1